MKQHPDIDATRAAIAEAGLMTAASAHLTETVAMQLPFESLGDFKTALKRYFSREPWTPEDASRLSSLVAPHLGNAWWEHDLGDGITLAHGLRDGMYELQVTGGSPSDPSVFDRVFSGPVIPSQTPHPRKVRFAIGGKPAPGVWFRRGEDIDDRRVEALMEPADITDVMVAGDFVTVGLHRSASWEDRIDAVIERVTELFWDGAPTAESERTREGLMDEAGGLHLLPTRPEDLHLMDADNHEHREVLIAALGNDDPRHRRSAVAALAMSVDQTVVGAAVVTGYRDASRMVRRAAIDVAADLEEDRFRPLFEEGLLDRDAWIRWRSVRSLGEIGAEPSAEALVLALADEEFRVRFEANSVLRQVGLEDG